MSNMWIFMFLNGCRTEVRSFSHQMPLRPSSQDWSPRQVKLSNFYSPCKSKNICLHLNMFPNRCVVRLMKHNQQKWNTVRHYSCTGSSAQGWWRMSTFLWGIWNSDVLTEGRLSWCLTCSRQRSKGSVWKIWQNFTPRSWSNIYSEQEPFGRGAASTKTFQNIFGPNSIKTCNSAVIAIFMVQLISWSYWWLSHLLFFLCVVYLL